MDADARRVEEAKVLLKSHARDEVLRRSSYLQAGLVLLAHIDALKEEIEDANGAYRSVIEEACEGGITYETDDRLHCTCVPHLRNGVKDLTTRLHEAERARDSWREGEREMTVAYEAVSRLRAHAEQRVAALEGALDNMWGEGQVVRDAIVKHYGTCHPAALSPAPKEETR